MFENPGGPRLPPPFPRCRRPCLQGWKSIVKK